MSETFLVEKFSVKGTNVLHHKRAGNSTTFNGVKFTGGIHNICLLIIVEKGASATLTLNIQTADDANGTNATAITSDAVIYKNNVRLADGKTISETASSGISVFTAEIMSGIIPEGKFLGVAAASGGNAADSFTVIALPYTVYHPAA